MRRLLTAGLVLFGCGEAVEVPAQGAKEDPPGVAVAVEQPQSHCLEYPHRADLPPRPTGIEYPTPAEACAAPDSAAALREGTSTVEAPFGFTTPPACIATSYEGQRHAQACRVERFTGCGRWVASEFFDADGNRTRSVSPAGDSGNSETLVRYENGKVVFSETVDPWSYRLMTATYAPNGQEVRFLEQYRSQDASWCHQTSRVTTLNAWGMPEKVDHDDGSTSLYLYDEHQRLTKISGGSTWSSYKYDSEGWLRNETRATWSWNSATERDRQGRPVHRTFGGSGGTASERWNYGPHGILSFESQWSGGSAGTYQAITDFDDSGRAVLEWRLRDGNLVFPGEGLKVGFERVAIRRTFSCDGLLLLEEFDRDADGSADARREYARDQAGNLRWETEYEGSARTQVIHYRYDCD